MTPISGDIGVLGRPISPDIGVIDTFFLSRRHKGNFISSDIGVLVTLKFDPQEDFLRSFSGIFGYS